MNARSLTLDELIALNAEIAALVRSGVPLERGLAELGADLPGRLGQFATALAEKTARGEPLDRAILADAGRLPSAYRAVVEAGVRAGRLPAALEAVASAARRLAETSRSAALAAIYPLLVFLAGWCGLVFFTVVLAPRLARSFAEFSVPGQGFFAWLTAAGKSAWIWGPLVPLLIALLVVAWWLTCTRATVLQVGPGDWLARRLPWLGKVLRWSRTATFLEVLALLVENQSPLPDALVLAGEASGDPATLRSVRRLATALEQGQVKPSADDAAFPPLVNWLLMSANRDGALLPALRHAATAYHRRAQHESELLRVLLPVALTITVGGTVTALYALALFMPYVSMLHALGR